MRLAVIGSRTIRERSILDTVMGKYVAANGSKPDLIVTGDAIGADSLAMGWSWDNQVDCLRLHAKWTLPDGKKDWRAGFERNKRVVSNSDGVLALWTAIESPGTAHVIYLAQQAGMRMNVVLVGEKQGQDWKPLLEPYLQSLCEKGIIT